MCVRTCGLWLGIPGDRCSFSSSVNVKRGGVVPLAALDGGDRMIFNVLATNENWDYQANKHIDLRVM